MRGWWLPPWRNAFVVDEPATPPADAAHLVELRAPAWTGNPEVAAALEEVAGERDGLAAECVRLAEAKSALEKTLAIVTDEREVARRRAISLAAEAVRVEDHRQADCRALSLEKARADRLFDENAKLRAQVEAYRSARPAGQCGPGCQHARNAAVLDERNAELRRQLLDLEAGVRR